MTDNPKLRRIQPIIMPPTSKKVVIDFEPKIEWVFLHQLFVNDAYQRSLGDTSYTLIRSIAKSFRWTSFHVPIVTPCENQEPDYEFQCYELLDGQHTSIGALTNGSVRRIPVLVVAAKTIPEKAASFVDLNTNNVRMSKTQLFWAKVSANDEVALEVNQGVSMGGGTICKRPPPYSNFLVGEIMAVGTLEQIAKRGGVQWVKRVVEAGVASGLAPIGAHWLRAFCLLLLDEKGGLKLRGEYKTNLDQVSLTVRMIGADNLMRQATADKGKDSDSMFRELAYAIKRNLIKDEAQELIS